MNPLGAITALSDLKNLNNRNKVLREKLKIVYEGLKDLENIYVPKIDDYETTGGFHYGFPFFCEYRTFLPISGTNVALLCLRWGDARTFRPRSKSSSAFSPRTVTWHAIFSLRRTRHWRIVRRHFEYTSAPRRYPALICLKSFVRTDHLRTSPHSLERHNDATKAPGQTASRRSRPPLRTGFWSVSCSSTRAARVRRSPDSPTEQFSTSFSMRILRIGFSSDFTMAGFVDGTQGCLNHQEEWWFGEWVWHLNLSSLRLLWQFLNR